MGRTNKAHTTAQLKAFSNSNAPMFIEAPVDVLAEDKVAKSPEVLRDLQLAGPSNPPIPLVFSDSRERKGRLRLLHGLGTVLGAKSRRERTIPALFVGHFPRHIGLIAAIRHFNGSSVRRPLDLASLMLCYLDWARRVRISDYTSLVDIGQVAFRDLHQIAYICYPLKVMVSKGVIPESTAVCLSVLESEEDQVRLADAFARRKWDLYRLKEEIHSLGLGAWHPASGVQFWDRWVPGRVPLVRLDATLVLKMVNARFMGEGLGGAQ